MKHSDSLHRVCFIHLYIVASRILSLIAWAIVKRWKEFGIKHVRICKTHSFSHWTRWIQTIVELSGTHFERVVRHIPCCFKMCQNMSTFFRTWNIWKELKRRPELSSPECSWTNRSHSVRSDCSTQPMDPPDWSRGAECRFFLFLYRSLRFFWDKKRSAIWLIWYSYYDSYEIIWYIWSVCSHIHYLGVGNIEFWMYLTIRETLGVTRASHELIAYPPTQRLKLAVGLQRLGYAYAIIIP